MKKTTTTTAKRLTPGRFILAAALLVGLLVLFPLFTVWKQVYITDTSRRLTARADSLATLTREVARLSVQVEELATTQRIETIARRHLNMDYPGSDRIVIVDPEEVKPVRKRAPRNEFLAVLYKSLKQE
jgi:cell division protein FtsL